MCVCRGIHRLSLTRINSLFSILGKSLWGIHLAISSGALYLFYLNYKKVERDQIEMRSAKFALMPLLFAERDREYLKQLRRNRDEEAKLMANVPGWEVGTLYGEKVFKSLPEDSFVDPPSGSSTDTRRTRMRPSERTSSCGSRFKRDSSFI